MCLRALCESNGGATYLRKILRLSSAVGRLRLGPRHWPIPIPGDVRTNECCDIMLQTPSTENHWNVNVTTTTTTTKR